MIAKDLPKMEPYYEGRFAFQGKLPPDWFNNFPNLIATPLKKLWKFGRCTKDELNRLLLWIEDHHAEAAAMGLTLSTLACLTGLTIAEIKKYYESRKAQEQTMNFENGLQRAFKAKYPLLVDENGVSREEASRFIHGRPSRDPWEKILDSGNHWKTITTTNGIPFPDGRGSSSSSRDLHEAVKRNKRNNKLWEAANKITQEHPELKLNRADIWKKAIDAKDGRQYYDDVNDELLTKGVIADGNPKLGRKLGVKVTQGYWDGNLGRKNVEELNPIFLKLQKFGKCTKDEAIKVLDWIKDNPKDAAIIGIGGAAVATAAGLTIAQLKKYRDQKKGEKKSNFSVSEEIMKEKARKGLSETITQTRKNGDFRYCDALSNDDCKAWDPEESEIISEGAAPEESNNFSLKSLLGDDYIPNN